MAENPFLLPPGSRRATPAPAALPPVIVPRAEPPVRHPDSYIAVPPSVESATHRIARPATAPVPISAQPAPALVPMRAEPIAEETQLATPAPETPLTWTLQLPDGTRHPLTGPLVLGRDPIADPARAIAGADVALLPVVDTAKTVSKTHALLLPEPQSIRVVDLHSTNGVAIMTSGTRTVLAPGGEGFATAASRIELGSFTIAIAR